jgi:hypothetical protein
VQPPPDARPFQSSPGEDVLGVPAAIGRERSSIDASYVAYDSQPLDEEDAWGDLASFRAAAADSRTAERP